MTAISPSQLKAASFAAYPPKGRALLEQHLDLLRQLPLILLPLLLREAITYDWRFPIERMELEEQLTYLSSLSKDRLDALLGAFNNFTLTPELTQNDWINTPSVFIEQLTAQLWATQQMDSFYSAADQYAKAWQASRPQTPDAIPRLSIVVIGKGVASTDYPLFRKLRPHGVYFPHIAAGDGLSAILDSVNARATAHPMPYGHWYIDGGKAEAIARSVTTLSYGALDPARKALLGRMQSIIQSGSAGPELLRTQLAQLRPGDIGLPSEGDAGVLGHFQMNLLTEGSGTQIFATTFAQWAARETLRRAQPTTLLVRFAPRQRQQPMNELLSNTNTVAELDPQGSLIDADMAAYYTWLNQQRLSGSADARFLTWFEGHDQALAIGPSLPRGTVSSQPATLQQILSWIA